MNNSKQQLDIRSKLVGRLAMSMSHEACNVLAIMIGNVHRIEKKVSEQIKDESLNKSINQLSASMKRLEEICENIFIHNNISETSSDLIPLSEVYFKIQDFYVPRLGIPAFNLVINDSNEKRKIIGNNAFLEQLFFTILLEIKKYQAENAIENPSLTIDTNSDGGNAQFSLRTNCKFEDFSLIDEIVEQMKGKIVKDSDSFSIFIKS